MINIINLTSFVFDMFSRISYNMTFYSITIVCHFNDKYIILYVSLNCRRDIKDFGLIDAQSLCTDQNLSTYRYLAFLLHNIVVSMTMCVGVCVCVCACVRI